MTGATAQPSKKDPSWSISQFFSLRFKCSTLSRLNSSHPQCHHIAGMICCSFHNVINQTQMAHIITLYEIFFFYQNMFCTIRFLKGVHCWKKFEKRCYKLPVWACVWACVLQLVHYQYSCWCFCYHRDKANRFQSPSMVSPSRWDQLSFVKMRKQPAVLFSQNLRDWPTAFIECRN